VTLPRAPGLAASPRRTIRFGVAKSGSSVGIRPLMLGERLTYYKLGTLVFYAAFATLLETPRGS